MKGNQYLLISLHLRREYRLVKVDIGTADAHHSPREFFLAQKARVPIATWGQAPIILDILDSVPIVRARNYADLKLHSKRCGSSGKHWSGVALTKMCCEANCWSWRIAVGRMLEFCRQTEIKRRLTPTNGSRQQISLLIYGEGGNRNFEKGHG